MTAAASSFSLLWNVMLGRSLTVHSVKPGFDVNESARYGWATPSTSNAASGS